MEKLEKRPVSESTVFRITGSLDPVHNVALSKGHNRVGVSFSSPENGNRSSF
jgi:hypothetical protein